MTTFSASPVVVFRTIDRAYPHAKFYLRFRTPLDLIVAAILSAQVPDERVNEATKTLFKRFRTAKDYAQATPEQIIKYIKHISYAGNKARHIHESCKILVQRYGGRVPKNIDDLTSLPGIGRKTANTILQNAYGIIVGIPCDTHALRVSYRLGWTLSKNPVHVEQDLMRILPKRTWSRIPRIFKAHGQAVCKAPVPLCSACCVEKVCPKRGVTRKK